MAGKSIRDYYYLVTVAGLKNHTGFRARTRLMNDELGNCKLATERYSNVYNGLINCRNRDIAEIKHANFYLFRYIMHFRMDS